MRDSFTDAMYKSLDMVADEMSPEELEAAIISIERTRRVPRLDPVPEVESSIIKINWQSHD
jgi:hypothetical protein